MSILPGIALKGSNGAKRCHAVHTCSDSQVSHSAHPPHTACSQAYLRAIRELQDGKAKYPRPNFYSRSQLWGPQILKAKSWPSSEDFSKSDQPFGTGEYTNNTMTQIRDQWYRSKNRMGRVHGRACYTHLLHTFVTHIACVTHNALLHMCNEKSMCVMGCVTSYTRKCV